MVSRNDLKRMVMNSGEAGSPLLEHQIKNFLAALGVPVPRSFFIRLGDPTTVNGLNYPLVAKVSGRNIPSKTEVHGVRLAISTYEELTAAIEELRAIPGCEGVLVEEMAVPGLEVIVGGVIDPQFGPIVMFGLGGIFVELFRDVAFALAPIDPEGAARMVLSTKGSGILGGYRGKPPVDRDFLTSLVVIVSEVMHTGLVEEINLNPVVLYPAGGMVVDAKLKLSLPFP